MTNGSFGPGLKEAKVSKTKKMSPKRQLFFISICVDARLVSTSRFFDNFELLVSRVLKFRAKWHEIVEILDADDRLS